MAVVINTNAAPGGTTPWNNQMFDLFGQPGGPGNCLYVYFCTYCAAGDVARYAGRDYFMSCCIIPAVTGFACCWWACDRQAFIARYRIADSTDFFSSCLLVSFCTFCALTQALNHARAMELKGQSPGGAVNQTVIVVGAPAPVAMVMAPQPVVAAV